MTNYSDIAFQSVMPPTTKSTIGGDRGTYTPRPGRAIMDLDTLRNEYQRHAEATLAVKEEYVLATCLAAAKAGKRAAEMPREHGITLPEANKIAEATGLKLLVGKHGLRFYGWAD